MDNIIISIAIFCLVIICSNIIQGITGFAGTLIAMPFLIMLVDLETAKQVLNLLGILASLMIIIKDYKLIKKKQLLIILFWMTIGLVIGMIIYKIAPRRILLIVFPLFVLAVGIKGILKHNNETTVNSSNDKTTVIDILLLLFAGIIHGLFVAGGPLLVIYATEKIMEKNSFRATLSAVWIFLNSIMLIQAITANTITVSMSKYMLISIIPMFAGVIIGNYLLTKLSQQFFMKLSYTLLILSGISLLL